MCAGVILQGIETKKTDFVRLFFFVEQQKDGPRATNKTMPWIERG
jgi:hypothetical protein